MAVRDGAQVIGTVRSPAQQDTVRALAHTRSSSPATPTWPFASGKQRRRACTASPRLTWRGTSTSTPRSPPPAPPSAPTTLHISDLLCPTGP
jgi:hypothetical protein